MESRHERHLDSEGLWDWNPVSNRIHFSPRWVALVGCSEQELGNTRDDWMRRVHPDELADVERALTEHLRGAESSFEMRHRLRHKDGSYRWTLCRAAIERDATGRAARVRGMHADVTAAAVTDQLTGLPNRLLLNEHLERSIERARRYQGFHFAALCVDLDQSSARDQPLAPAAEALVIAAARRLETCLRLNDTRSLRHNDLVARLNADRFVILLDGLKELSHASIVADRILAELLAPFTLRGRNTFVSASIGIAVSATGYERADDVVRDAETAVHRARMLGKARWEVFDTAVFQAARTELQLEADFAGSLERQEFRVVYQPVVLLESRAVVGFEALVRWEHPILGTIAPNDFIPLAEKSGFIVPLGQAILRDACAQMAAWHRLPGATDLWVSVNLSPAQLVPPLVDEIGAAIAETGIAPRALVVELTEGAAIENRDTVRSLLMRLRTLGVRVSIDDFGTGHSALASLRHFPLDHLKVDRSFVRGIEDSHDMAAILASVTALARQLGLKVVVEGIENDAQLAAVRAQGCDYGQGYLFARPLSASDATALLQSAGSTGGLAEPVAVVSPAPTPSTAAARVRSIAPGRAAAAIGLLIVGVGAGARLLNDQPPPMAAATAGDDAARESSGEPGAPSDAAGRQTTSARPASVRAATKRLTALRVEHRHRIGGCRGVITVSRTGISYAPESASGRPGDGFTLGYDAFFHEIDDDGELVLRASGRTYRFKALVSSGINGSDQVRKLVTSMSQLR
jgi:diguanylate cyclase (GGDEF)-like protein/PAS domain S-box-containing protein